MIRPATREDVPALVALGQHFLAESSYAGTMPENPAQMAATAQRLIDQPDGTVLVSVDHAARIHGTIGLVYFAHHFSGLRTMGEAFFFVAPAARGSVGVQLLLAAKGWGRAHDVVDFQVVSPDGATRVEQFYAALRFRPLERAWVLAL